MPGMPSYLLNSPARRYIFCTAAGDIFRKPHKETSALSGTTFIIIAESAKQITPCLEKGEVADSDRDLAYASALPGRHMNA